MGLDDILAALRHEAEEEVARIDADADAKVAEIMGAARAEAGRVEAEAAAARNALLSAEAEVVRNRASLHVDRRLQEERESICQEVLRRGTERLGRLRGEPQYRAVMRALLAECRTALPDAGVVMVAEPDAGLVRELLAELGATVEVEGSLETSGGLDARNDHGAFVRNTFEERLDRSGPRLRCRIGELVPELREGGGR